ncbi:MAG: hypothetical protein BIFFINMI_04342 [Phycisphaerae bacterium]|nr:hypothetical protein [Phycisphaerae bacterium]
MSLRLPRRSNLVLVLASAALPLLAGGCDIGKSGHSVQWFQQEYLKSDVPVLVVFHKDHCPTCEIQEAEIQPLKDEYKGRVRFDSFFILNSTFGKTEPQIRDYYNLGLVPTTVVFVNGREQARWVGNASRFWIRPTLEKLAPKAPPASTTSTFGANGVRVSAP